MAFKFKSSGVKIDSPQIQSIRVEPTPIGIKTPMELGTDRSGIFAMHFNIGDQIADNFRNLLLTNKGDRLGRSDFGANLRVLVSELSNSPDFESKAMSQISDAVQKYMPFIDLESFSAIPDQSNSNNSLAKVDIRIVYNVQKLGISKKQIIVSIYANG